MIQNIQMRMITGEYEGANIPIDNGDMVTIGRNPQQSQLLFKDEMVSRKHCSIHYDSQKDELILTNYSKIGTYINGQCFDMEGFTIALKSGDAVRLGKSNNEFRIGYDNVPLVKKKSSKKLIIGSCCGVALVVTCIVLLIVFREDLPFGMNKVKKEIGAIVDNYNLGNTDYDSAYEDINEIYNDNDDYEKIEYIEEQLGLLEQLKESKARYDEANVAYGKGDYEKAMKCYGMVIEEDENHQYVDEKMKNAQSQYIKSVDEKADIYIKDKKYLKAIDLYKAAKKVYDDGSIDKKIADLEKNYRANLEKEAKAYEDKEEWEDAIKTYNSLYYYFEEEAYQTKITNAKNSCINKAISEAEVYLSQENYSDAKSTIKSAEIAVGKDKELTDEMERIESFEPVDLMDIKCDREQIGEDLTVDKWTTSDVDNYGGEGYTGLKISSYAMTCSSYTSSDYDNVEYSRIYTINGNYDTFTGILAVHEDSSDMYKNAGFVFAVIGDGEILYSYGLEDSEVCTELLNGDDRPVSFEIDVSGVSELKIFSRSSNHDGDGWLTYDGFTYGLLDLTLKKNYVK